MSLLTRILQQTWRSVEFNTNFDGDQVPTAYADIACRFRYNTQLQSNDHAELVDTNDAIVWFEPSANIKEGDIGQVDGKYWRVDSLVKARRLVGSTVVFLKAYVKLHELAVES